jgi:hypothetical protein
MRPGGKFFAFRPLRTRVSQFRFAIPSPSLYLLRFFKKPERGLASGRVMDFQVQENTNLKALKDKRNLKGKRETGKTGRAKQETKKPVPKLDTGCALSIK